MLPLPIKITNDRQFDGNEDYRSHHFIYLAVKNLISKARSIWLNAIANAGRSYYIFDPRRL